MKWDKVTWYSKLTAIILFILLIPLLSFYIGTQYQETIDTLNQVHVFPFVESTKNFSGIETRLRNQEYRVTNYFNESGPKEVVAIFKNGIEQLPKDYCPTMTEGNAETNNKIDDNNPLFSIATSTIGDINDDGIPDAVIELDMTHCYGNGVEPYMIILVDNNNAVKQVASVQLEEKAEINKITIENGIIYVDVMVHSKNDPSCCPSIHKTLEYKLINSALVQIS